MRTEHGRVKLIDFGSARDAQQSAKTVFTKGVYTAPEQKLGDKQRSCTDIYAVGVTMFLLLVGRVPTMTGAHLEPLRAAKKGLNEETYRVFENATALNPNYRYQKAEDMLADLERARHTLPRKLKSTKRRNASADVGDGRKNKMRKIKGVLMIFCLLLLLLVFLIFIFGSL